MGWRGCASCLFCYGFSSPTHLQRVPLWGPPRRHHRRHHRGLQMIHTALSQSRADRLCSTPQTALISTRLPSLQSQQADLSISLHNASHASPGLKGISNPCSNHQWSPLGRRLAALESRPLWPRDLHAAEDRIWRSAERCGCNCGL